MVTQHENRICQNCKASFEIEPDDFSFYEKIKVPAPTFCSECRMIRRLSFGNAWGVHFRNCDNCSKKTLAMYHPNDTTIVYCDQCWWSDQWDGTEYAADYDPNRPFLEQWQELRMKTPHFAKDALYLTLQNCDYTNAIAFSKNCYMTFWADYCEGVYYSSYLNNVRDCIDVFRVHKSELSCESVGIHACSKTHYSTECADCVDVWFSRNCYGCMNCVGCVNLRGKSYMIFNKQYSKEEYFKSLSELRLNTRTGLQELQEKAEEFSRGLPYREYTGNTHNLNVSGDYLYNSRNAKECFMCSGVEDCKYTQFVSVPKATNCMDYYGWGNSADLIYECATSGEGISNLKFSFGMFANGIDSEYCGFCIGSNNNFGSVNLKRKKYCILNKEYSKEEYEKLRERIIKDMEKNPFISKNGSIYKYGEFFPAEFSPFPYSDSNASRFFKKTKEEVLSAGFKWQDIIRSSHTATMSGNDLPESILESNEDILNEIIGCTECGSGFKITKGEFDLHKKLSIPISGKCPKCREKRRFETLNMLTIRRSNCHKCSKEINTAFPKDSNKIIYCESCYQKEVM